MENYIKAPVIDTSPPNSDTNGYDFTGIVLGNYDEKIIKLADIPWHELTFGNLVDIMKSGYYPNTRILMSQKDFWSKKDGSETDKLAKEIVKEFETTRFGKSLLAHVSAINNERYLRNVYKEGTRSGLKMSDIRKFISIYRDRSKLFIVVGEDKMASLVSLQENILTCAKLVNNLKIDKNINFSNNGTLLGNLKVTMDGLSDIFSIQNISDKVSRFIDTFLKDIVVRRKIALVALGISLVVSGPTAKSFMSNVLNSQVNNVSNISGSTKIVVDGLSLNIDSHDNNVQPIPSTQEVVNNTIHGITYTIDQVSVTSNNNDDKLDSGYRTNNSNVNNASQSLMPKTGAEILATNETFDPIKLVIIEKGDTIWKYADDIVKNFPWPDNISELQKASFKDGIIDYIIKINNVNPKKLKLNDKLKLPNYDVLIRNGPDYLKTKEGTEMYFEIFDSITEVVDKTPEGTRPETGMSTSYRSINMAMEGELYKEKIGVIGNMSKTELLTYADENGMTDINPELDPSIIVDKILRYKVMSELGMPEQSFKNWHDAYIAFRTRNDKATGYAQQSAPIGQLVLIRDRLNIDDLAAIEKYDVLYISYDAYYRNYRNHMENGTPMVEDLNNLKKLFVAAGYEVALPNEISFDANESYVLDIIQSVADKSDIDTNNIRTSEGSRLMSLFLMQPGVDSEIAKLNYANLIQTYNLLRSIYASIDAYEGDIDAQKNLRDARNAYEIMIKSSVERLAKYIQK